MLPQEISNVPDDGDTTEEITGVPVLLHLVLCDNPEEQVDTPHALTDST